MGTHIAGGGHGPQAREEVEIRRGWNRRRVPTQGAERKRAAGTLRRRSPQRIIDAHELTDVPDARTHTVEPGAFIGAAWRSKGRAGKLFRVKPVGTALRRVPQLSRDVPRRSKV